MKHKLLHIMLLSCAALAGCDSSFHRFDGTSGYTVKAKANDLYQIEYTGRVTDSLKDIEMMWHHAARETCHGGSYQHRLDQPYSLTNQQPEFGNALLPKEKVQTLLKGDVYCLAPNFAAKQMSGLSMEHFTANEFIGGRTTN